MKEIKCKKRDIFSDHLEMEDLLRKDIKLLNSHDEIWINNMLSLMN